MVPKRRAFWRLALVFLGAMAVGALLQSPLFSVESVAVSGGVLSAADVVDRTGLELPAGFFTIKTGRLTQKLLEDPKIASVKVSLGFPNRLKVALTPRVPVLAAPDSVSGRFALLGEDLVVVSLVDRLPRGVPVLNGLRGRPPAPGLKLASSRQLAAALAYWRAAGRVFGADKLSEVFADTEGRTTIYLRDGRRVIFGDIGNSSAKEEVLRALVKQLGDEGRKASELNLTDPDRPLIRS